MSVMSLVVGDKPERGTKTAFYSIYLNFSNCAC